MAEENEKKDSSAVGRINSLAGKGRNLQRAYGAYKKARAAWLAGEGLGALAGPAVGVGIGVVILVVVIIMFSGAAPSTVVGGDLSNSPSPTESSTPGPTTQPGGLDGTDILVWGRKINSVLTKALGCSNTIYNRQQSIIRNTAGYSAAIRGGDCQGYGGAYLCTRLVKDAYNLAGIKNNLSEWTPSMVSQWGSIRGLTLLKTNNVRMVKPGDAVFWYGLSGSCNCYRYRHADLIDAISVNSSGNGVLYTIDANVNQKLIKHYVSGWKLLGNVWLPAATNVAFGLGPR